MHLGGETRCQSGGTTAQHIVQITQSLDFAHTADVSRSLYNCTLVKLVPSISNEDVMLRLEVKE